MKTSISPKSTISAGRLYKSPAAHVQQIVILALEDDRRGPDGFVFQGVVLHSNCPEGAGPQFGQTITCRSQDCLPFYGVLTIGEE